MRLFTSWSGGKDCTLALYRILQDNKHEVTHILNMCDTDNSHSRSHGMPKHLIAQQAASLGIEILQPVSDFKNYETIFKETIKTLKEKGVAGGVFGDIYLQVHRDWIERVCAEMEIQPFFPLWENNTTDLLKEFINDGFKTIVVSVNSKSLPQSWLGREINEKFIADILKLEGIDPCAENGEYHSFVYDGPIFKKPVTFSRGREFFKDNHWFLNLQ
ncbi:MAG TPA: diphthine--ammonia ligase [Bacteroidales bacterium]